MATDLDKLQGAWDVTSLEADGQKMPAGSLPGAKIVVKGKRFTSIAMGATYSGTVEINQKKKPRALDLVFTDGPEKGNRNLGIYKLDAGVWTICLATRGDTRPRMFATKAGTGLALETLEREGSGRKSVAKKPAGRTSSRSISTKAYEEAAASAPVTALEGEWAMVSGVLDGNALAGNMVSWCTRTTRGSLTTVLAGPQTMVKARFTLDTSKRPHSIDYVNLTGSSKGKSQAGIFEFAGDELRICMAPPGKPRPTDFASKAGDGRSLTTWKKSN